MQITLRRSSLMAALACVTNLTKRRTSMPILANVMIELAGGLGCISGTDLEVSVSAPFTLPRAIPADHPVHFLANAAVLSTLLARIPEEEIALTAPPSENAGAWGIAAGQAEFTFPVLDPANYPEILPVVGSGNYTLSSAALLKAINKVQYAVSRDEARYVLTGMHMALEDGILTVVGTDGFRASAYQVKTDRGDRTPTAIVPGGALKALVAILPDNDAIDVNVTVGTDRVGFYVGDISLVSRQIQGNYPDWRGVMPQNTIVAEYRKEALTAALRRCMVISGTIGWTDIDFQGATVVSAESDIGTAKETIEAHYDGDAVQLAFNGKYLAEAIAHLDDDLAHLKLPSGYGAVLIEEGTHKQIVMPVRH